MEIGSLAALAKVCFILNRMFMDILDLLKTIACIPY